MQSTLIKALQSATLRDVRLLWLNLIFEAIPCRYLQMENRKADRNALSRRTMNFSLTLLCRRREGLHRTVLGGGSSDQLGFTPYSVSPFPLDNHLFPSALVLHSMPIGPSEDTDLCPIPVSRSWVSVHQNPREATKFFESVADVSETYFSNKGREQE
jgi:hypothetical protein